jgi:hypothetical protein
MPRKKKMAEVEAFVRKVLKDNFNQNVDRETLRSVAEKVSRAIEIEPPTPKKAA